MEGLCDDFEKGAVSERALKAIPAIAEKVAEREKLKYRLRVMKKVWVKFSPTGVMLTTKGIEGVQAIAARR